MPPQTRHVARVCYTELPAVSLPDALVLCEMEALEMLVLDGQQLNAVLDDDGLDPGSRPVLLAAALVGGLKLCDSRPSQAERLAAFRAVLHAPGLNLAATDDAECNVLHVTARWWLGKGKQLDNAAEELVRKVPDLVSTTNEDGNTPLHVAAAFGSQVLVKHLLSAPGVDANAKASQRWTPLHLAVAWLQPDAVRLLLDFPAVDVPQDIIFDAVRYKDKGRGRRKHLLLSHPRVNAGYVDDDGSTLWHYAPCGLDEASLQDLLRHKDRLPSLNHQDASGGTVLHEAAALGADWGIPLLLGAGADPRIKNNAGQLYTEVELLSDDSDAEDAAESLGAAQGEEGQQEAAAEAAEEGHHQAEEDGTAKPAGEGEEAGEPPHKRQRAQQQQGQQARPRPPPLAQQAQQQQEQQALALPPPLAKPAQQQQEQQARPLPLPPAQQAQQQQEQQARPLPPPPVQLAAAVPAAAAAAARVELPAASPAAAAPAPLALAPAAPAQAPAGTAAQWVRALLLRCGGLDAATAATYRSLFSRSFSPEQREEEVELLTIWETAGSLDDVAAHVRRAVAHERRREGQGGGQA